MIDILKWFFCSVALGAIGVWWARSFAIRKEWLDRPNDRSFHKTPTPRIGGAGVLLPIILTLALFAVLPRYVVSTSFVIILVPSLIVALISFFDDRFDLSSLLRFLMHLFLGGAVLYFLRDAWAGQPLPLIGDVLPVWFCAIVLVIWFAGLTNAYNFMDGIDGIAAIQGIVALCGWLLILWMDPVFEGNIHSNTSFLLILVILGGLVGFMFFNWSPASIFMGDIGSTFLGFVLAGMPFAVASLGLPFEQSLEAAVLFVWPFILDTGMTFARRLILRESVFNAHRTHLYQILAGTFSTRERGHRLTSLFFGCLSLLGVGLYWSSGPVWAKLAVIGGIWVSLVAWTYGIRRPSIESALLRQKRIPKNTVPDLKGFDIFLSPPEITGLEYKIVAEAFDSGYIAPVGPQVIEFEKNLSTYLGLEEVHVVSSGTAAIHLGLRALGVGPGDCVLCPDLTFIASCNPVRYLGAEPVLVDVDPATWAMDPDLAREAIRTLKSEGRTVRAMIVVHALGIPAPMPELVQVAREEGVLVMEDCAGAFGSKIGGTCVGNFGDVAVYSFNGNKVLTTSGGGALYIKDRNLRASARSWANQGKRSGVVGYEHDTLGYNYKLSNICAAVGLAQLETLGDRLQRKKALYESYRQCFAGIPEVHTMPEPDYGMGNYWLSNIGLASRAQAGDVVYALRQERIEASPLWKPMHLQTLNQDLRYFGGDASSMIHSRYLSLPSGTTLTREQIEKIASIVRSHLPVVV